jgi:nucleoside-diphosphate-sugar epimerase
MILVTGGAGFIGSSVIRELLAQGYKVRALDCFLDESYSANTKRDNWKSLSKLSNLELLEFDLRNVIPANVLNGVSTVINEAAMPGLVQSWKNFSLYNDCNAKTVFNLLEAAVDSNVQNFIQISTSSVYGNLASGNEKSPLEPISPYGVTKLAGEELVRMFNRTRGINYSILRYFSVYGPGQRPDMAYHRFINAILQGQPIEIFGDGSQIRTNTYIEDCVLATILAVKAGPLNECINISGDDKVTLSGAIAEIEEKLSLPAIVQYRDSRIGDQFETSTSIQKAKELLGYTPKWSYKHGISEQIQWHKFMNQR